MLWANFAFFILSFFFHSCFHFIECINPETEDKINNGDISKHAAYAKKGRLSTKKQVNPEYYKYYKFLFLSYFPFQQKAPSQIF